MNIHGPWTSASAARLLEIKDVTDEDAALIRKIWHCTKQAELEAAYPDVAQYGRAHHHPPTFGETKRWAIDRILRTCGVEYLGEHKRSGKDVYYCNTGESYAGTVVFQGRHLRVGSWGDLVERELIREPKFDSIRPARFDS